jgi:dynein heavy chain, axonemal
VVIGKQLNDSAKTALVDLNEQLGKIQEELQRSPDTMDDLKFMLNVIDQIYSQSVDIEARFLDIEVRNKM